MLDRKLRGFADAQAVMTGVETRSSSPVRILRDEGFQALVPGKGDAASVSSLIAGDASFAPVSPQRPQEEGGEEGAVGAFDATDASERARAKSSGSGLYPCGEGAGYAGGIMSAAVDGLRVAEAVARGYSGRTGGRG